MGLFRLVLKIIQFDRKYGSRRHRPFGVESGGYKAKAQSSFNVRSQIQNLPSFKVEWVVDGDTVIVASGRTKVIVRLDSIDCPEDGQYWGDVAKYGLIKLIGKCHVRLETHGVDQHRRTLATIYAWNYQKNEWFNVNEKMVLLGHAWVMRKFYDHLPEDRQNNLNRLENWARSKRVGLWRNPDPIPPWVWRRDRNRPSF